MYSWKKYVSSVPSTSIITDITQYVESTGESASSIDCFYNDRNDLIRAMTPTSIAAHPHLSSLSLVGLVSVTENYFRSILAEIIRICPIAKEKSAERPLNLASVWFGYSKVERGAFENISFSNADEIKKNLKKISDLDIDKVADLKSPLKAFAELCELRHAIVHCAGHLTGKNAIKLHLSQSRNAMKVKINFDQFQEAAGVCTSLVQAINHELFDQMINRWAYKWPQTAAYRTEGKFGLFKMIWLTFLSEIDMNQGRTMENITALKMKNKIDKALSGN